MRDWVVASALLERDGGLLLVRNKRHNGSFDWTPPGGVVEVADGEDVLDGLAREVVEETGLEITAWHGPVYEVEALAPGLGWHLRVEVHLAAAWDGDIKVGDDPDGIVVGADFVDPAQCLAHLAGGHPWVVEPVGAWLEHREAMPRRWRYEVEGDRPGGLRITRLL